MSTEESRADDVDETAADGAGVGPETVESATAGRTVVDPAGVDTPAARPPGSVGSLVAAARAVFDSGVTRPVAWRRDRLKAMNRMLLEHRGDFTAALAADLGKHPSESWLTELGFLASEITHTIKHLDQWLAPRRADVPLALQPAKAHTILEPLGVVLVIAPWNYPIQLVLAPVIGALAAGNTVVAKPSEMAPACAAALARWIPVYLGGAVTVVEGGVPETSALLEERFDHIFYTGNGRVGSIVMAAAARQLTPVTLELGGKSPVYIDDTVDMKAAAARIAWGKFMNAGQTCVAPDYVLGTASALFNLAAELPQAIRAMYGGAPSRSGAYGHMVSDAAFGRVAAMLDHDLRQDGTRMVTGGRSDPATRYIEPTVLHVEAGAVLMEEEIFGPVLPLVTVESAADAVRFVNARDKPLSLYVFSEDRGVRKAFTEQTSSGALNFGVPAAHLSVPGLPFGGVGGSGMGAYHGQHSVETFSHRKAVLDKPLAPDTLGLIYPPFGALKRQVIKRFVAPAGRRFGKN
ncbi:aldehyde dehydrogenase family protein [Arthrobacter wenxiniae]|uniref:Aldehyde dehydrogenase n=1 Tax=Arthrobacter wenxiniae TaxID=2713570 RepID=A0A7Y7IGL4_9MICC|nr:aldehyde dehydrogenase family protein [Arthrobacter wenxiniae]NVM94531.1 aldehyde dehydrogenase family protein [Arthrobacter wenxiniae]